MDTYLSSILITDFSMELERFKEPATLFIANPRIAVLLKDF